MPRFCPATRRTFTPPFTDRQGPGNLASVEPAKELQGTRSKGTQPGIALPLAQRICPYAHYLRDPLQHFLRIKQDFSFLKVKVLTSAVTLPGQAGTKEGWLMAPVRKKSRQAYLTYVLRVARDAALSLIAIWQECIPF